MSKILSSKAKKNLSFCIHPDAKAAFHFYHSIESTFDQNKLKSSGLIALHNDQIFRASYLPDGRIGLISGFEMIGFSLILFNKNNACVLIDTESSSKNISKIAWRSVIRVLCSSSDSKYLEIIRLSLNDKVPSDLLHEIFGVHKITQKYLSLLTRVSISGLKKKAKNIVPKMNISQPKPDFFTSLKERHDVD